MSEQLSYMRGENFMPQATLTIGEQFNIGYGNIHAHNMHEKGAAEVLAREVEQYRVAVSPDAASACIDGRNSVQCMDGQLTEPRAKVAGGGLVTAYAGAELTGWFAVDAGDSDMRMHAVHEYLRTSGIVSGGHCDEAAAADDFVSGKTGCGANDRLPEILQRLYADKSTVDSLAATLLGDSFDSSRTDYLPAEALAQRHADWKPATMIHEIAGQENQHNVEVLASDDSETHGHNELAVVFNYQDNTTINRDALVAETGKQVFCVDVWYLKKLARHMTTGPDAVMQESELLHAMVSYQAATYLTLCDGSQRPIILHA